MVTPATRTIDEEYQARFPKARELYAQSQQVFPSGVTHDGRFMQPFPIYISRALASRKWDVDGNEFVDYWVGHGSLLHGHSHPDVVQAVTEQVARGTHYGGSHEREIAWGMLVQQLIPSAERVKFVSSGTEATMMALRLARSFTGRTKILKYQGHFHGWHDYATAAVTPPFDVPTSTGVPAETLSTVLVAPPNDISATRELLAKHEVAAVILEPGGASNGTIPVRPGFLQELRDLTRDLGVVLIFDEVITGFRYSPGGAQQYYGVTPDMTTLAKILAGGLPGGAVVGKREIMELLEFKDGTWNRRRRISHPGTYNGNPLSAAAGTAVLRLVATGKLNDQANRLGDLVRAGTNEILRNRNVRGYVYGECSQFHILLNKDLSADLDPSTMYELAPEQLMAGRAAGAKLRRAMLLEGIDLSGAGGMLSGVHTDEDIDRTIAAFDRSLIRMQQEGDV